MADPVTADGTQILYTHKYVCWTSQSYTPFPVPDVQVEEEQTVVDEVVEGTSFLHVMCFASFFPPLEPMYFFR